MKLSRGLVRRIVSGSLIGSIAASSLGAPPPASAPASVISKADAARVSAESIKRLIESHRLGYDLTYVARTTLARDLPAWRVAAGNNDAAAQLMLGLCNYYGLGGAQNLERGRTLIRKAADAGHPEAIAVMSILLRKGTLDDRPDPIEANRLTLRALQAKSVIAQEEVSLEGAWQFLVIGKTEQAIAAYETSIKLGSVTGKVMLAGVLRRGWLRPMDLPRAISLLEEAANDGHVGAMTELGLMHANGRYVPHDDAKARRWLDAAAATGDARGLAAAAYAYESGRVKPGGRLDIQRAKTLADQLAANGDPYSAFRLYERARNRRTGDLKANVGEAQKLLIDAATRGVAEAYAPLSYGYYDPEFLGLAKDLEKSERLVDQGVAAGDPAAMFQRANAFRFGYYAAAEEDAARDRYFAAARLGFAPAMTSVGLRFMTGRGVPQDVALGHACYLAAAFEGDLDAISAVASQFLIGYGTTADKQKARDWCMIGLAENAIEVYATLARVEGAETGRGAGNAPMPPKALAAFEAGVQAGSLTCERELGDRLVRGQGVARDVKRGIRLLEHAAKRDAQGISDEMLGIIYADGQYVPRDTQAAAMYFNNAAAHGSGDAWARLSLMAEFSDGVAHDPQTILKYFDKGIALGSSLALFEKGRLYMTGTFVERNYPAGVELWKRAAEQHDITAARELGTGYLNGFYDLPVDEAIGLKYIEIALREGDGSAAASAGSFYRSRGDFKTERQWLDRGAALGDPRCLNDIGVQYRFGRGVEQDFKKCADAYRRAAEYGDADGQTNYAWCLETGNGVDKDIGEAFRLQLRAALTGNTEGMFHAGRMYLDGIGIARDQQLGLNWLIKSAAAGNKQAEQVVNAAKAKGLIR